MEHDRDAEEDERDYNAVGDSYYSLLTKLGINGFSKLVSTILVWKSSRSSKLVGRYIRNAEIYNNSICHES